MRRSTLRLGSLRPRASASTTATRASMSGSDDRGVEGARERLGETRVILFSETGKGLDGRGADAQVFVLQMIQKRGHRVLAARARQGDKDARNRPGVGVLQHGQEKGSGTFAQILRQSTRHRLAHPPITVGPNGRKNKTHVVRIDLDQRGPGGRPDPRIEMAHVLDDPGTPSRVGGERGQG